MILNHVHVLYVVLNSLNRETFSFCCIIFPRLHASISEDYFRVDPASMTCLFSTHFDVYRNDPKFWDIKVWANSADPDQTAPRGAV